MDKQSGQDREEQDIGRLLRAAGPRQELPDDLRQQWEQAFRRELAPALARRGQVRRRAVLGLCASVLVAGVALLFTVNQPATPQISIRVSHVSGDHRLHGAGAGSLQAGQLLPPGSRVSTGDNGRVALSYQGYDLRLNGATAVTLGAKGIELKAGEIYASDDQRSNPAQGLLIATPHGTVRDIGTQFMVTLQPDQTITTVRKGTVLVDPGNGDVRVEASGGAAMQVRIGTGQQVHRQQVAPSGDDWRWIYQGGPGFELEGSSAHEFLQWSVAESGLRLEFATQAAEIYARTTLLHGDLGDLDPEQAVDPVLATTDLRAELAAGNTLRISLGFRG